MTLRDFIKGIDRDEFAKEIGVSISALNKYIYGDRIPRPKVQVRIEQATGGKVTPSDWMKAALQKEAA